MRRPWIWIVTAAVVAVAAFLVFRPHHSVPALRPQFCSVRVGETYAELDFEQSRYASLIAAIGTRRGLPARASTIAIATAYQESKIHDIDYGDRDSLGLFQQRPSQGWGTRAQVSDPHYAINRFFDALVRIDRYRGMSVAVAAQRVQRSAYGGAYAKHEDYARALASALTGQSPAAYTCQVRPADAAGSPRALRIDVRRAFGKLRPHTSGRTVTYPIHDDRQGWAVAQYVVANARRLHVAEVAFDGRRWTAKDSPKKWVKAPAPAQHIRVRLAAG